MKISNNTWGWILMFAIITVLGILFILDKAKI